MVEDISFPKNLPKVSRTNRIKRTARQSRDNQKQPFQRYLNQNEDNQEKNNEDQQKKKQTKTLMPTQEQSRKKNTTGPFTENRDALQDSSRRKGIDVRA